MEDGSCKYVISATPVDGYILDYWEYRTAKDGEGGFTGEYTRDWGSAGRATYTTTVAQDTEYRAVFKSSVDAVQLVGETASIFRAGDNLWYRNFTNQYYNASGMGEGPDDPRDTHRNPLNEDRQEFFFKEMLEGSFYFNQEYLDNHRYFQYMTPPSASDTGVEAYDNVVLAFAVEQYNDIKKPVAVEAYAGEGLDGALLYRAENITPPVIGMRRWGYGNSGVYIPVDAMPFINKVTVRLTVEGMEPVVRTYTLGAEMVDTGLSSERGAAVAEIQAAWGAYMADDFSERHTRYSQEYLMMREEYRDGLEAVKDAETAEEITAAKERALQYMADAVGSVFHSGIEVGYGEGFINTVVTVPWEASAVTVMAAAYEQRYPGVWAIHTEGGGAWVNGFETSGGPGRIVGGEAQSGSWTYGIANGTGVRFFANGVQNQQVWDGLLISFNFKFGFTGSLEWDVARLKMRHHNNMSALEGNAAYAEAVDSMEGQYGLHTTGEGMNSYVENYVLDPSIPGDARRIAAHKALRLDDEFFDFLNDRKTEATRSVILAIAALDDQSAGGEVSAAKNAYQALGDTEKPGVFNYDDLLVAVAAHA
ncbi:MAG: hypothetical protein LBS75_07665, partial [Synergistaceae bacterium]|nr:hypothetical protein [Synergistaceae bacterium]